MPPYDPVRKGRQLSFLRYFKIYLFYDNTISVAWYNRKDLLLHNVEQPCSVILNKGGVVRKMENLGEQELPHRMRAHTEEHTHGTESKKANMKESKSNFWGGYG